jgi:hypothetical protein
MKFPLAFGTNSYTQQQRNNSWDGFKAYLFTPSYRNLYYYGHGGPDTIGCDIHTFDTNGSVIGSRQLPGSTAFLSSQTVSNQLTFNRYAGARPYRFVWLDGCSTANGNWPGTFGVDKVPYDIDHYTNSLTNPKRARPSAFVGWNQEVGGPGWGNVRDAFNFRGMWMEDWSYYSQTEGLWFAYDDACDDSAWPPGVQNQLWGALCVYGYEYLLLNGYNQKTDWPSP